MKRAATCCMVLRGFVLGLMFTLASLVPLPLPACPHIAGAQGPCECPMMIRCAGVGNAMSRGPAVSCRCVEAGAPIPKADTDGTGLRLSVLAVNFPPVVTPSRLNSSADFAITPAAANPGPPKDRVQFCTFLI